MPGKVLPGFAQFPQMARGWSKFWQQFAARRQRVGMRHPMSRLDYPCSFALILAIAACGGSSPEPAKPSPQPAARDTADLVPMCKRIFARKATCADDYLPVLLDLRVELNIPSGIGDEVKSQGRDAVLAIAHTELARDTETANVDAVCETAAAQASKAPPERRDQLLEQGARCEAATDCKGFAVCVVEIDRSFIVAGAQRRAAGS
ncbi:MAG TPA: hypothetical protein VFV99_07700 [Kofleriaceae bacterium]|nr:hypothetical protein [Kofleriaceae bacterium]